MKNEFLYNKTVDFLVQSYFNGTLLKGNCTACAIGNIVGGNKGIEIPILTDRNNPPDVPEISILTAQVSINIFDINVENELYKITGYSFSELRSIERTFERESKIHWLNYNRHSETEILIDQFNGLMAVIDVLDQIHKNTSTEITTQSKSKFNKPVLA